MESLEAYRKVAIAAARAAGKILLTGLKSTVEIGYKGDLNLVTNIDLQAEEVIVEAILSAFPDHLIFAEEGHKKEGVSPFKWIIDPLDGTTNYAHAFPIFCVSIGLEVEGEIGLGVVYDPVRPEMFIAERGTGATLNGSPIHVSSIGRLTEALLVTGFSYDLRRAEQNNLDHFANFSRRAQAVRRTGSAALDLCYVASGRFDGFWEIKLHPWDVAAGMLIVTESGGNVTDFSGAPFRVDQPEQIVASNGLIHQEMIEVLRLGSG